MNLGYIGKDQLLGRAETDFKKEEKHTGTQSKLGRDAFLKLLVTQLKYQDPTSPMDDKEMTAQLAQFSSLESLNNIDKGIEDISSKLDDKSIFSGINFLNTEIKAPGHEISKQGKDISNVTYTLKGDTARTYVNIFDQSGNILNTVELGPKKAGSYSFTWDGKDFNGNKAPDGKYVVSFGGEDKNGKSVLIDTQVYGKVVAITKRDNNIYLRLADGREIAMDQVSDVSTSDNHQ